MVVMTGNCLATPFHILNLSLEDAYHSAHSVTHVQDITVDHLQFHFRFTYVLPESNTSVANKLYYILADCQPSLRTSSCPWIFAYK